MAHALAPIMVRLLATLESALPESEVRQLRALIDTSQLALALEWISDAASQRGLTNDPQLRQLLVQLGTQLGIAASINERLRGA